MSGETTPTQQGGEPEFTPAYSGRMAAMQEIAKRAHAEVAGDLSEFNEETGEVSPAAGTQEAKPEEKPAEKAEGTPEQQEERVQEPAPDAPAAKMVSITVDGRAIEVPEDKIIEAGKRTLQKESAADRRLQEAVAKERQAQQLLDQAKRLSGQDAADSQNAPSQDAQQPTQATNGLDPEALDVLLERKLYARDAEKAAAQFAKDYADIASDPHLFRMAVSLEDERLATAAALGERVGDPFDAYRKHGETIRTWLKARTPAAPVVNADKADKKRSITAIGAVNAVASKPQEQKPKTVSEQVEEMRQARLKGRPVTH